jgi:hypothetical protein
MRRCTSLRSSIVRRHQLAFQLMPLPYRRWIGLIKIAQGVAVKVNIAAAFVTRAGAPYGTRGRRRFAISGDLTIHDSFHPLKGRTFPVVGDHEHPAGNQRRDTGQRCRRVGPSVGTRGATPRVCGRSRILRPMGIHLADANPANAGATPPRFTA